MDSNEQVNVLKELLQEIRVIRVLLQASQDDGLAQRLQERLTSAHQPLEERLGLMNDLEKRKQRLLSVIG